MSAKMTWKGDRRILRMFKRLPIKLQRKHTRAALRQGANVILRDARSSAPRKTGALARSLKVKGRRTHRRWLERMVVTTPNIRKQTNDPTITKTRRGLYLYSVAHEFGTATVRAKHFLQGSAERNWQQAVSRIREVWKQKILQEAAAQ